MSGENEFMSTSITENNETSETSYYNDIQLFDINDLKRASRIQVNIDSRLVRSKRLINLAGKIEEEIELDKHKYYCVKCISTKIDLEIRTIEIFSKSFQGFIIEKDQVEIIEKGIDYWNQTKIIDTKCIISIEDSINGERHKKEFIQIKDPLDNICGKILKRVLINDIECVEVENINSSVDIGNSFYVKVEDVELISNLQSHIKYHNQIIIKPNSILQMKSSNNDTYKINDLVSFEDVSERMYQGKIAWTGRVNGLKAALIALKEGSSTEDIVSYLIGKQFRNKILFDEDILTVCVVHFALKPDAIAYITCSKTKLEIVDHKFKHPFQKEPHNEKLLLFKCENNIHSVILKWKGLIYNQSVIGCQLRYESEQGSNGTYGSECLFKCPQKTGIILTAHKINYNNLTDLCEFSGHKDRRYITTKHGFKIYDKNHLCCIEHSKSSSESMNFSVGCKIMYDNKFIGVCKFIGNVNDKLTVGIETLPEFDNGSISILDYINYFAFQTSKFDFLNATDVTKGTYYKSINMDIEIDSAVDYCPTFHGSDKPLSGILKWIGTHDYGNLVCGIALDCPPTTELSTNYFFESDLFEFNDNCGVIDDYNKIKYKVSVCVTEQESKPCEHTCNKDEIVKMLLKKPSDIKIMMIAENLIKFCSTEFIEFISNNFETIKLEDLAKIYQLLYENNKLQSFKNISTNADIIIKIFPLSGSFLLGAINGDKLDIFDSLLTSLKIPEDDDKSNSVCLELAIECLKKSKKSNESKYINLYESLVEKCSKKNCLIQNDTILTKIITNTNITEDVIVDVLNSKIFDINQSNKDGKSPMQLSIMFLRQKVLKKLFELNCKKSTLNSDFNELVDLNIENKADKKNEMIKLINNEMMKTASYISSKSNC